MNHEEYYTIIRVGGLNHISLKIKKSLINNNFIHTILLSLECAVGGGRNQIINTIIRKHS